MRKTHSMTRNDPVSLKVLLVEDDDGFRRTVAESVNTRFPSVVLEEAADGSEVLEKVKTFLPQLVFMDIKLPGQNGLELTRQIKTLHPERQSHFQLKVLKWPQPSSGFPENPGMPLQRLS